MSEIIEKSQIKEFFHGIWAFELLNPEQLDSLMQLVTAKKLKKGEILWLQGQNVTNFSVVYSGQLRSMRISSSGKEKLLSILNPGHHFGLAEVITEATSAVMITAAKDTVLLTISHNSLRKRLLSNPEICYRLMQTMARAIFKLTRDLERTSFENVHTRLARLLLKNKKSENDLSAKPQTETRFSHEQLAMQLGVSRETVSRALSDFRKEKLIETTYRQINVLDPDSLMQYVDDFDQW